MKNIDKLKKTKKLYNITLIILWILLFLQISFIITYNNPLTTKILSVILILNIIIIIIYHTLNKNLKSKINTMDTITKSIEDSK